MQGFHIKLLATLLLPLILVACGGGGGSASSSESAQRVTAVDQAVDDVAAYRFLTQASFGPTRSDAARVKELGYAGWIDAQFDLPVQTSHLSLVEASSRALGQTRATGTNVTHSWWTRAVRDPAQLRHRVAFALSQIFVVSTLVVDDGRRVASYLDTLTQHADANYRDLLEAVALHPAMGQYLSHLMNRKEDGSGRVPDENFAREVMQLFSIGLYELDDSGRPKLTNGKPTETYGPDDIKGLAKVFTGFSWSWPTAKSGAQWWQCFWRNKECEDDTQDVTRMRGYGEEHSSSAKKFLGVTVPAQEAANPQASLKAALDRLASHPNTAPFISRQLIQRLITSNPSDQYVRDITSVFRASGGNLRAVVKAILLHEEARNPSASALNTYGKVREPVLKLTHLLRALPHESSNFEAGGSTPFYLADDTSDPGTQLGQTPMKAPSVFNFFRPGYTAPQSAMAQQGLVAPEMQITTETTVLGYANFVTELLDRGWGQWNTQTNKRDIQFDLSRWYTAASNPITLIDTVARDLLGRPLDDDVRDQALLALQAMPVDAKRQRVQAAILMVAVSPEFVIQQ